MVHSSMYFNHDLHFYLRAEQKSFLCNAKLHFLGPLDWTFHHELHCIQHRKCAVNSTEPQVGADEKT